MHVHKFKLFIDIKSSKWIIIKNNKKLTLTQPEMLATRIWANPGLIQLILQYIHNIYARPHF
jgi:hypothetical protein